MTGIFNKKTLVCLTTLGLALALNAGSAFGQETTSAPTTSGGGQHKHHHHHRGGFFLGACVGQALMTANPPILFPDPKMATMTKEQRKAQRLANKPVVEAAKAKCKAEFRAMGPSNGGGSSTGAQQN